MRPSTLVGPQLFQPNHGHVPILNGDSEWVAAHRRAAGFLPEFHCPLKRGRKGDLDIAYRSRGIAHPDISAARSFMQSGFHRRVAGLHLLPDAAPGGQAGEKLTRSRRVVPVVTATRESAD